MINMSNHQYDDIIDLTHHVSETRPRMSMTDRAAQFSPFAALTGHKEAVKETERLTDEWIELTDDNKAMLDGKLQTLLEQLPRRPEVTITYFEPDRKKTGGAYISVTGVVKKIDAYKQSIVLEDGKEIAIGQLYEIEGEVFERAGSSS